MGSESAPHRVPRHIDLDVRCVVIAQEPVHQGFPHRNVQLFPNRLFIHTHERTRASWVCPRRAMVWLAFRDSLYAPSTRQGSGGWRSRRSGGGGRICFSYDQEAAATRANRALPRPHEASLLRLSPDRSTAQPEVMAGLPSLFSGGERRYYSFRRVSPFPAAEAEHEGGACVPRVFLFCVLDRLPDNTKKKKKKSVPRKSPRFRCAPAPLGTSAGSALS